MTAKITDLSTLKEHPFYCLGDRAAEVCAPLFNNFPISYFNYAKVTMEKSLMISVITLTSGQDWFHYYCKSKFKFLNDGKKMYSWLSTMYPSAQREAGIRFGLYNGLILEKIHPDHIEALEFASPTPYTSPIEFCSNKELVNQFIIYFKDKAKGILKAVEQEPLYFPQNKFLKLTNLDHPYDDFCYTIKTQKIPLKFKSQEVIFTRREFEVLSLLTKGKSMREVGRTLSISPRTVESYLYNAKDKTKSFTVNKLLESFASSLF
jgi:DNA-binding CsgD family transcriptional regulator